MPINVDKTADRISENNAIHFSETRLLDYQVLNNFFKMHNWIQRTENKWHDIINESYIVCTSWDKDKLIGTGRSMPQDRFCVFYDVAVHPDYERRGIGAKIIDIRVKDARDRKYSRVYAFVDAREPLLLFYEAMGFEKANLGGKKLNVYFMRKDIC